MGKFIFDGDNRRVYINNAYVMNGAVSFTAVELWSRYVDWVAEPGNSVYPPLLRRIGGVSYGLDANGVEKFMGTTIFFRNDLGWRGIPPTINGISMFIQGPFYPTDAQLPIMINNIGQETDLTISNPVDVIGIATGGSAGPTAESIAAATVQALSNRVIDAGMSNDDILRLIAAVLLGKVSGAGTGIESFRDLADTKDRIIATIDNSGNRTAITLDAA